jgi:hypothetical protein
MERPSRSSWGAAYGIRRLAPMPGTEQPNLGRIRTAQIGNTEKREPRRLSGPKFALAGPDSLGPICQNPAKEREILVLAPAATGKSGEPETVWR